MSRTYWRNKAQHKLAASQMTDFGTVVTFTIRGGKPGAFKALNGLRIIDISNNLGDSKSLICHPATTTPPSSPGRFRAMRVHSLKNHNTLSAGKRLGFLDTPAGQCIVRRSLAGAAFRGATHRNSEF